MCTGPQLGAICLRDDDYPASLEVHKVYQVIHDPAALEQGYIRIIDESGEDYLYPEELFVVFELPEHVAAALRFAA